MDWIARLCVFVICIVGIGSMLNGDCLDYFLRHRCLCCCQLVIVGLLLLETLSSVKWTNPGFLFASLLSFSKLTSCMQLVTVGLISMIYNTADAFGHPQASNQSINSFKCDINPIAHMDAILARKKRWDKMAPSTNSSRWKVCACIFISFCLTHTNTRTQ